MEAITFDTTIRDLEYLNSRYLFIPASVVEAFGGCGKKRVIVTINGKLTYQSGFMALGEGNAYITINAARMKQLGVTTGDAVEVKLEEDKSRYGMEMPPELEEVLRQDPVGAERFSQLRPAMQRYVLYHVAGVKNPQSRVDRALKLIGNLKRLAPGKESFKEMLGK